MIDYLANKILSETPARAVDHYVIDTRKEATSKSGLPLIEVENLGDPEDSSTWSIAQ